MSEATQPTTTQERLDFIDGLKGLAILMVMFFHASLLIEGPSLFVSIQETLERLSRGVQLFFIVSAFSICFSVAKREGRYRYPTAVFYIKRFFRIQPLWWLTVILYHFYFGPPHSNFDFWATFFLYFGFFPGAWTICFVPIGWSLFVEEVFYVFFPLIWKYVNKTWKALLALGASLLIGYAWMEWNVIKTAQFTHINPLANFYAFFVGIFLYFLYQNQGPTFENLKARRWLMILNLVGAMCVWMVFKTSRLPGTLIMGIFFFTAFFSRTLWGLWMRRPLLRRFGVCCYSLYLFHAPIYCFFIPWQKQFFQWLGMESSYKETKLAVWFLMLAPVCLWICEYSWQYLEKNSILLGRKCIQKLEQQ